jgi:hypothetical protein
MIVDCFTTHSFADSAAANSRYRIVLGERMASAAKQANTPTCAAPTRLCAHLSGKDFPGLFFFDGIEKKPMLQVPLALRLIPCP